MGSRIQIMRDECGELEGDGLEFRLTYEGPLLSTQKDPVTGQKDAKAPHKHAIRQRLHPQLKRLWEITPHLRDTNNRAPTPDKPWGDKAHALADEFSRLNYRFVPLVTEKLSLLCGLDILYLRLGSPGKVINAGDIDNRLKTLFDALRMPEVASELTGFEKPGAGEDPFFVLLQDDELVTSVSVETDHLLEPIGSSWDANDARLLIKVKLRPYDGSWENINFL